MSEITGILPSTRVCEVLLDSGLPLVLFGTQDGIRQKFNSAGNTLVSIYAVGRDAQTGASNHYKILIKASAVAYVGPDKPFEPRITRPKAPVDFPDGQVRVGGKGAKT